MRINNKNLFSFLILILVFYGTFILQSFSLQKSYSIGYVTLPPIQNGSNSTKVIIIAFDDSPKSQFTLAKPILDVYGFKGSFFIICNYVNNSTQGSVKSHMTWQDIKTLQQQGHDIESHTMTHTNLENKSRQGLLYEIGGSKQCLLNHGINSTIFAYPYDTGSDNTTVVNVVSKYYDLARSGDAPMAFLHCNGYKTENNCTPFNNKGNTKYENRYDIKNWSDRPKSEQPNQTNIPSNNSNMFAQFIQEVNLQSKYNKNGCINAIPIVAYHIFINDKNHIYLPNKSHIDVGLFSNEMKYLYDNGFKVLKMSDLGYNANINYLYIKGPLNALMRNC